MAMELFKLLGTIAIDNAEANKALDDTSKKGKNTGSKLGSAFKSIGKGAAVVGKAVATGMAVGATAVSALVTKSVQAYAEFEQLEGGVETLFGTGGQSMEDFAASIGSSVDDIKKFQKEAGIAVDGIMGPQTMAAIQKKYDSLTAAQDAVMKNATKAYKTAGLSANEYMETVTGFSASLISSLGGDTEKAAALADQAIIDMSDNANKMGTDIASIQNAYQGFAKQNYTMLDNLKLGYGGTKEEMQRLLKDAEKLTGKKFDISNFADITEAIHAIQTEMGITGTTATEASTTISGSISSMKASWENLLVAISADDMPFDQYVDDFTTSVATVADNLIPRIGTALEGVVSLVDKLAPVIIEKLPGLFEQILPSLIEAATGLINSLVEAAPGILESLMNCLPALIEGITTIFISLTEALPELFQVIIEALPVLIEALVSALPELLPALIDGIVAMIVALCTNFAQIIQPLIDNLPLIIVTLVDALMNNLPALIEGCVALVVGLVAALPQIIQALVDAAPDVIIGIVEGLIAAAPLLVDGFVQIWNSVNIALDEIIYGIVDLVVAIWNTLWDYLSPVFETIKTAIVNAWETIKTNVSTAVEAIKTTVSNIWEAIKTGASTAWNAVKNTVSSAWNTMKTNVSTAVNAVKTTVSNVWNAIKTAVSNTVESIKTTVSNVWNSIKTAVSNTVNSIKTTVSNVWTGIKASVSNVMTGIKTGVSTAWTNIKTTVSTAVTGIKTKVTDIFNGIKTTVSDVWENIKNTIKDKIEGAKDLVSDAIDKIKGLFDFEFKWPKIPMPHFSISGTMNPIKWFEEGTPKLSVEWYAKAMKTPMLMNSPTIFGYDPATGNLRGGGEAGSEITGGTSAIMGMIRAAVAGQMNALAYYLEKLLEVLESYFPQVISAAGHDIVTNDGVIIGRYAPMMDEALGEIQKRKDRGW